tara:strand:+ start:3948 stop:5087 length:1140 start_codon:yes stop_codon:yes gene_type:complete
MLPTTTTTTTESSKEDPELCELFDTTSDDHVPEDTVLGIVEEHVKETDGRISAIQDVQDETDVIMRGLEADMNSRFATVFLAIDSLKRDFDSLKRENTELRSKIVALERALENSSSPPKPSFKEAALAEKPKKPSVSRKKPSRFSERKVEFRLKLEELFGMIGFEPNGFRIVSPQTLKPSKAQIERIIENFNLGDISPDATYQLGANMLDFVLVGGERLPFNVVTRGVNNCSLIPKGMKTVPTVEGEFQTKFMEAFNTIVHMVCIESEHMNWLTSLSNKDTPTPILLAHIIHYWNVMFPFVDTAGSLFKFNISHNGGSVKVRVYIDGMMWNNEHLPSYEGDIARDILRQINVDRTERSSKFKKVWKKADESLASVEVSS